MNAIISLVAPIAQIYLLFKISRSVSTIAADAERKQELVDAIEKFGNLFAKAPGKKVVSFTAKNDDE